MCRGTRVKYAGGLGEQGHSDAKAFVSLPNLGWRPSVFLGNICDLGAKSNIGSTNLSTNKDNFSVTKTLLNVTTSVCPY